jgi:hypothetical protein
MAQEVIYTDGHKVKVTPRQFIVGKTGYLIRGITNIQLHTIRTNPAPGIILMILGIAAGVLGYMQFFNENVQTFELYEETTNRNQISLIVGGVLFILGVIWLLLSHERYAVRLTTAEGERNAVVSTRKDYIGQIVKAVNSVVRPDRMWDPER